MIEQAKIAGIKLFETKEVLSAWDAEKEPLYFSIVDVVTVLTNSPNQRKYCSLLKTRLKKEGRELTTNCSQLKIKCPDGKQYLTSNGYHIIVSVE
jgi:aspartyl aminopeptidase